jgi:hypothetical protein
MPQPKGRVAPLVQAHLLTQARLRWIVRGAVVTFYRDMGVYNEDNVEYFVDAVTPIVFAGQRQAIELTEAFVTRRIKTAAVGLAVTGLTGAAVRAGVPLQEVYRRPFVTVWSALEKGVPWQDAVDAGEAQLAGTAEMDVQLSHRAAYSALQEEFPQIKGYQRAANANACDFCNLVHGAFVKSADAMPLHNRCGCGLDPIHFDNFDVSSTPEGVAVHNHGELGPLLTDPAHEFTGPSDI